MSSHPNPGREGMPSLPPDCKIETLGIAFFDLSRIMECSNSQEDARVAAFLQEFYLLGAKLIGEAGGRIVKYMGDAGLVAFPTDAAEPVICALGEFSGAARALAREHGLDVWLNVNIHVGPVVAGTFGPPGEEQYDVIGKTVNVAARLGRRGVTLSQQAFRCLSPEARERFDKIKPPVTYRLAR
jgi:class 3 adenylate cyclase